MSSLSPRTDFRGRITRSGYLAIVSLLPLSAIACQSSMARQPLTELPERSGREARDVIRIDTATDGRKWSGWGCSLSWWANLFGGRDDLADALFTTKAAVQVSATGTNYTVPGLGLNVVRYNIGGTGEDSDIAGKAHPNNPKNFPDFKRIRGFWLNWNNPSPDSPSWNWSRDARQRAMLIKARQRGANVFEAFSTSPMWWMTHNKSSAGAKGGGNNLQDWNQKDHARYMATVALVAAKRWGIPFQTISPFNEPNAYWWKYPGGQEGCHFDNASQAKAIAHLRKELDARGLNRVAIAASEENSMDDACATWAAIGQEARDRIGQVNVHGYSGLEAYRGPKRTQLADMVRAAGKRISLSEYGDPDRTGATLAESILYDLRELRPDSWVYWQPLDGSGWGLIHSEPEKAKIGLPGRKWYVMAQFSRHLRQGITFLHCADGQTVAAYDAHNRKLTLVTVNNGGGRPIAYDLSGFAGVQGPVTLWQTDIRSEKSGARYQKSANIRLNGKRLEYPLPPGAVLTFEVQGVSLPPP